MTIDELYAQFEQDDPDFPAETDLTFITKKSGQLGVFDILEHLLPADKFTPIAATAHDMVYLGVDLELLAKHATVADIAALQNYGVFICQDSLAMFV